MRFDGNGVTNLNYRPYNFDIKLFIIFITYIYIIVTMKKGTVKFFNGSKGFGFIIEDDSNTEYFVHVSGLIDEINEGDTVEFELKEGKKGLNAVNVKIV